MILKTFAVYDAKLEAYLQPFFMQTTGAALRAWDAVVNDPSTQFFKNPEDFTLFEIGEYDDQSGTLQAHPVKLSVGIALQFKKSVYPNQRSTSQLPEETA